MPVVEADLVLEDGTGVATANTYIGLADAIEYHRLRGNNLYVDASENDQCVTLIRATQYLDTRWIWRNEIAVDTQSLAWPRYSIEDRYGYDVSFTVPQEILDACCEYALEALGDGTSLIPLSPVPDQSSGTKVIMLRDKVGSLETETRYDSGVGAQFTNTYPQADRIVKRSGFTLNGNGNGGTMR